MSHEIRTPLNAILGFSDILEKEIIDKEQKETLSTIHSSGSSLLILMNDILDLSEIEAGKLDLEYSAFQPNKVFQEMKSIFCHVIAEKKLEFQVIIDPNPPQVLILDKVRLRQILFNLVGNALNFTETGTVKLTVREQAIKETQNQIDLFISIEDTGIGIPEDQIETIFGAFEQREGQVHAEYGGTGLGLAITKRLVEMMGGRIFVTSQIGVGSTFNVVLEKVDVSQAFRSPQHEEEEVQMLENVSLEKEDADQPRIETPEKLPELLPLLEGELTTCEALQKTMIINEVEEFATLTENWGITYHYPPLKKWGEALHTQASQFDVPALRKSLEYFPRHIETIRSLLKVASS